MHRGIRCLVLFATAACGATRAPSPGRASALTSSSFELPTNWGGDDASRHRPEAIVANAVSRALNDGWSRENVVDVIAALPVKFDIRGYRPYGDGQENAAVLFPYWTAPRPPIVGVLVLTSTGDVNVTVRLDRTVAAGVVAFDVTGVDDGTTFTVPASADADGDVVASWAPPRSLGWNDRLATSGVYVRPSGWNDAFPLAFHAPVRAATEVRATVPASLRAFADGGDVLDHESVGAAAHPNDARTTFDRLMARRGQFGGGYSQEPYVLPSIHASLVADGTPTAVGKGWTWLSLPPASPFKTLYTCFDARDLEAEANAGVPSSGGWHLIGDPAETIFNDLETAPIPVGSARATPYPPPPNGAFAYDLSDVATVRLLWPGEAFVTPAGPLGHPYFHWFFFPFDRPVCTEEWVHPCVPISFDFRCDGAR